MVIIVFWLEDNHEIYNIRFKKWQDLGYGGSLILQYIHQSIKLQKRSISESIIRYLITIILKISKKYNLKYIMIFKKIIKIRKIL